MKRFITIALLTFVAVVSCKKFDDSKIWEELRDHENRIALLEELCKKLNSDIINLQTIVTALETNDYIINASPLATGDGYTFLFKSGKSIVVYNGKDGSNGSNGKDGVTPQIGVKKDSDGIYYWTVNGEWLLVDGEKVRASAEDGNNGENGTDGVDGKDGVTPQFKIEEGYWYISYDNGVSWEMLGKAVGDNGLNGENGDSLIKYITIEDGYVKFVLNDENNTVLKLAVVKEIKTVTINITEAGTISNYISPKEAEGVERLVCTGVLNENDINFIYNYFLNAVEVDLSGCEYKHYSCQYLPSTDTEFVYNPYAIRALEVLRLPNGLINFNSFYPCLKEVEYQTSRVVDGNKTYYVKLPNALYNLHSVNGTSSKVQSIRLNKVDLSEGIDGIYSSMTNTFTDVANAHNTLHASCDTLCIPSSVTTVPNTLFYGAGGNDNGVTYPYISVIICKSEVPPTLNYPDSEMSRSKFYTYIQTMPTDKIFTSPIDNPLYVPAKSVDAYKNAAGWSQFKNIYPIE